MSAGGRAINIALRSDKASVKEFNNLVRYIEKDIHDAYSVPKFKWAGSSK